MPALQAAVPSRREPRCGMPLSQCYVHRGRDRQGALVLGPGRRPGSGAAGLAARTYTSAVPSAHASTGFTTIAQSKCLVHMPDKAGPHCAGHRVLPAEQRPRAPASCSGRADRAHTVSGWAGWLKGGWTAQPCRALATGQAGLAGRPACRRHPGGLPCSRFPYRRQDRPAHPRLRAAGRRFWDCCGSEDPDAPGCSAGFHRAYDDPEDD